MMKHDSAALRVLYLGGTGTISASCVRLSVESGMDVSVLNRGHNAAARDLPDGVTWLTGDVADDASLRAALGDRSFDAVVNFLSYDGDDVARMVALFGGAHPAVRAHQLGLDLRQAGVARRRSPSRPRSAPTPSSRTPPPSGAPSVALQQARAETGFPVTIVRPSHTYDDANPPLPGGWTVVDRIARGAEIPVHGDGTSLWTLTHAEDFAQGLVGLLGNPRAIGEIVQHHRRRRATPGTRSTRSSRAALGVDAEARARGLRALPGGRARLVLVRRDARRHRAQRRLRHEQDPSLRARRTRPG